MDRHATLGEFLRSRRARLRPEDVGMQPLPTRRRVPGLRREELAQLAGVSVDYYVRLEQGRGSHVSDAVLDAVANALRLADDERAHLRDLARPRRAARRPAPPRQVRPQLRQLLTAMSDVPAFVVGRRTDVLAWNALGAALIADFPALPPRERNFARLVLLDELWAEHPVADKSHGTYEVDHPIADRMMLTQQALRAPDDPDQTLVTYTAEPESPSEASLRLLASWASTARV